MTPIDRNLAQQEAQPALVTLHRALTRLQSVVSVMNTGAHPDDEISGALAYLRFAHGIRPIIACSTRGEGGQNVLGPERGGPLGLLRSQEMATAARLLDADLIWLGHGPDDPVHDFGFSKSGQDTLHRWGHTRIQERLVRAYREARPDVVITTFLDVPGQHGHHRAMTQAAEEALALAADPLAFPQQLAEGLTPWQVAKFYLPAVSGASSAYDDEVPPPPTTLTLRQTARDAATGADYDVLGQISRSAHASQGMGVWPDPATRDWPLHLKSPTAAPEKSLFDGLPRTLADLTDTQSAPVAQALCRAQAAIEAALAAFPQRAAIAQALVTASRAIEEAEAIASKAFLGQHGHRLAQKQAEIEAALFETAGLIQSLSLHPAAVPQGEGTRLHLALHAQPMLEDAQILQTQPVLPKGVTLNNAALQATEISLLVSPDAPLLPLFTPNQDRLGGNDPLHLQIQARIAGRLCLIRLDPELPLTLLPRDRLRLTPEALLVSIHDPNPQDVVFEGPEFTLDLPEGWSCDHNVQSIRLSPPEPMPQALLTLTPHHNGQALQELRRVQNPHGAGDLFWHSPAQLRILGLDLHLPKARIGYIGGGSDQVGLWLQRMGFGVDLLDEAALGQDLSRFTTVVIGVLAFGTAAGLWERVGALHNFTQAGGHLVTLYQRPSDGWQADATPPLRLQIGSPSLRWRVTDPSAKVTLLAPNHPLFVGPNVITGQDFEGWHKERGLYFASNWDPAYQPLLSLSDPGEAPLTGALLSAQFGAGRHSHVSMNLHHQMDQLVPGAFRIMANLMQAAEEK